MSIVRSALAGLATGGRTFSGISALMATVPRGTTSEPDATLAKPPAQFALGLLATAEVVADKLPMAPSRLDFPGLQGRLLFGAICGVVVARRSATVVPMPEPDAIAPPLTPLTPPMPMPPSPARVAACAIVGAASAYVGAVLGSRFRAWADARIGHDWIAALAEDATVAGLTTVAVGGSG